uniref:Uncharacterized protein n=1 Tax=Polytomella parva TaxID=51329 RepID=A0A7S0VVV3_9CHLO|mmetsp:Transcript_8104/g.15696  ORF Transcript_8104/g.15696 Transcript_8104/m.15696 type:complete len:218 (+) Transcript_8104:225-878(+)|eukprot:CAMPEP_0175063816 /NCGR_PEP_ID=MMETSP0052_2-20121109/14975_1 /TAXON_ID=51329 ORGANISM="Polytomella parva, Strain SAG 63-3" /NCGR_SAMPLE_ID=MMETSP0052_2 /ASSEMBLY_ACC=CAM_ASM_000194 /LENGTH=217 /DNA_ID=CAMNT_0016330073 /DNA_START=109 /DNA_END=762 /DNA_ORIENTATION=+
MLRGLFAKDPDPKELFRKWQATLRTEQRSLDRQIRDIQFEEKKVAKNIKEAAKRGDIGSAKHLAREIVQSRKAVSRLYTNKAQLISLSTSLSEQMATMKVAGSIAQSTQVMKLVNQIIRAPELQKTAVEMSREMMKVGLIEEMISDAMDNAVGDEQDLDEMVDDEISKILDEITKDVSSLPSAKTKPLAARKTTEEQVEEEDSELLSLKTRLEAVKN